jgi:hypothetical protein
VAAAVEANDGCAASQRVAELRETLGEEAVPDAIRREVERVAAREFTCAVAAPPPAVVTEGDEDDEDDDGRGRKKGKKDKKDKKDKGHGHGHDDGNDE